MADTRPAREPKVLELRVHGVNNTTPSNLLDLPPDAVRLVAGDKLGSFWEPTPEASAASSGGDTAQRGAIPAGVRREAYSWGGMVRTVPNVGGLSIGGVAAGVLARVLYAIVLPFSIGNAVVWSRSLSTRDAPTGWRSKATAGAARFFGLLLTLLYTSTAITLAIHVVAVQCGAVPARCGPLEGVLTTLSALTEGQRLALLSLAPVLAIVVLAVFSAVSRARYDVLPGMEGNREETKLPRPYSGDVEDEAGGPGPRFVPRAVLAQPGFWANRITTDLSRTHIAASIALTTAVVATQSATGGWRPFYLVMLVAASLLLLASTVLVWLVPTMKIAADTDTERAARTWSNIPTLVVLGVAVALLLMTLAPLAIADPWALQGPSTLDVDGIPLVIIAVGAVLAVTGIWWRTGGTRRITAWAGCGPAVFMIIALTVGVGTSAIVVVATADWLNGTKGPAALIGQDASDPDGSSIRIPTVYVVLGTLIVIALVLALVVILVQAARRRVDDARVRAWGAPATPADLPAPEGGVLPPSRFVLFDRIRSTRRRAAQLHLVEPAAGTLTIGFAVAFVLGLTWVVWTLTPAGSAPIASPMWASVVSNTLNLGMWLLSLVGVALVGTLALGGGSGAGSRPLGTVWDIACFLPRTGHPFGPPCYAERAVPEIAGHLNHWLQRPDRRAVLAAHSMGAVLSVAALGVLASSERTRPVLDRISLLTFGVQLRPFFGRMLPELLGPGVLGTHPARSPRMGPADPWRSDFDHESARTSTPVAPAPSLAPSVRQKLARITPRPTATVSGTLLRAQGDDDPPVVRWVSLWRLTDFLGYPAMSTAPGAGDGSWRNDLDRAVTELDTTGYLVSVGTHGEYYRTPEYTEALRQLARRA